MARVISLQATKATQTDNAQTQYNYYRQTDSRNWQSLNTRTDWQPKLTKPEHMIITKTQTDSRSWQSSTQNDNEERTTNSDKPKHRTTTKDTDWQPKLTKLEHRTNTKDTDWQWKPTKPEHRTTTKETQTDRQSPNTEGTGWQPTLNTSIYLHRNLGPYSTLYFYFYVQWSKPARVISWPYATLTFKFLFI